MSLLLLAGAADEGPDPSLVSPGVVGFLATFALVVAAILLFRSMTGHLRKVDHRARQEEADRDRAEESSLEDPGLDDGPDGSPDAGPPR